MLQILPGSGKPAFPLNILADFAGGGLVCVLGILLALIERGKSGRGQVVDTDMVVRSVYNLRTSDFILGFWHTLHICLPPFTFVESAFASLWSRPGK